MEQATLGSMLIELSAVLKVSEILRPEDFYRDAHRVIFESILALAERDEPIDILSVQAELIKREMIEQTGGAPYLVQLMDVPATAANVIHYAKAVADKAVRRRVINAGNHLIALAHSDIENIDELTAAADRAVQAAVQTRRSIELRSMREAVSVAFERIEARADNKGRPQGVPTGFQELDYMMTGLKKGELTIVAARPSMGKTACALSILAHNAAQKRRAVLFSLEMNAESIIERMIAAGAKVDTHGLSTGDLKDWEWHRIGRECAEIGELAVFIDDSAEQTGLTIRGRSQQAIRRLGSLDLILIDYLQLISGDARTENRAQEVGQVARSLKKLAKSLDVPVVALSQINRASEENKASRPTMKNLRDSGEIEQHADNVLLLHRPNYYLPPDKRKFGEDGMEEVEIIVAKQRNGPTGECRIAWHGKWTKFSNLAKQDEEPNYPNLPYTDN